MKKKTLVILCATLLFAASCDKVKSKMGGSGEFKSDEQKYSYAVGQQFGKRLAELEIPLDKGLLTKAIEDALENKSKMNDKQMQEGMMLLQDAHASKKKTEGDQNKKDGEEFLAKNKGEKDVQVTTSGIQYKVVKSGAGPKPSVDNFVEVHYQGTLIDGKEFDSSYKRNKPAIFGLTEVIKGWTEVLQLMPEGSKWKVFIPSELAYGAMDRIGIPANSVLVFDIELLRIIKPGSKEEADLKKSRQAMYSGQ